MTASTPTIQIETRATAIPCKRRRRPRAQVFVPFPSQRRRHLRVRVCVAVHLDSDSNFVAGVSNNISEGGIFVATYLLLPPGSVADLEFSLPDGGPPIRVKAVVRWVREKHLDATLPPGMGLHFVRLAECERRRIEQFVRQRETLLRED